MSPQLSYLGGKLALAAPRPLSEHHALACRDAEWYAVLAR